MMPSKKHEISNGELIALKRTQLGELLRKTHSVDANYIVPIPETATDYAQGYSHHN